MNKEIIINEFEKLPENSKIQLKKYFETEHTSTTKNYIPEEHKYPRILMQKIIDKIEISEPNFFEGEENKINMVDGILSNYINDSK